MSCILLGELDLFMYIVYICLNTRKNWYKA